MPRETLPLPVGRFRACRTTAPAPAGPLTLPPGGRPPGWGPPAPWRRNLILKSWGALTAPLLARGDAAYKIGAMYIEFANVAAPGDPAVVPSYDREVASGRPYYDGLATSPDVDYLRVPLIAAAVESSDAIVYPDGNRFRAFAQTEGVAGVWGKPFSDAANSVVTGGALVATVDWGDASRDLILSRAYLDPAGQMPKLAGSQVGIEWKLDMQ